MEREAINAKWHALHDKRQWHNGSWSSWAEQRSDAHPYPRDAGITFGVSDVDIRPHDKFLATENCGPVNVESEKATPAEDDASDGGLTTTD